MLSMSHDLAAVCRRGLGGRLRKTSGKGFDGADLPLTPVLCYVEFQLTVQKPGPFEYCLLASLTAIEAFEKLFFALFGQITLSDLNYVSSLRPYWTSNLFKFVFGAYLLMSVVVLITLLIAMMSDTYQRIQVTCRPELTFCSQSQ